MRNQEKKKYLLLEKQEFEKVSRLSYKPKLLMHTCCGVCASYPSLLLSQYFDLTLYYNNDNIYPQQEYQRRYEELVKLINIYNKEKSTDIKIVKTPYRFQEYLDKISFLKNEPERGARCLLCYSLRMEDGIKYAIENNYDYFTTVMTISRQKDSKVLNQIGEQLQEKYPQIKYLFSDFKKDNGQLQTNLLANQYGLYRQDYCGCIFSYNNRNNK